MSKTENEVVVAPKRPTRGVPEWQDYVVSLLTKNEFQDGNPTAAGLRRVAELVMGRVVNSYPQVIQFPNEQCNRAVVQYFVECCTTFLVTDQDTHEQTIVEKTMKVSALAESNTGNLNEPYSNHMVATAETRAEGRAFKKLLLLNFSTAEELLGNSNKAPAETASDVKIRAIKKLSSGLGLNFSKFLAKFAGIDENQFGAGKILSKEKADSLLSTLNDFTNDGTAIPAEILE